MPVSSCQEYFDTLPQRFVADASKGVSAVFQFNLSGDGGGDWHAIVNDGALEICTGKHADPSSTITASAANYVKIANGEMNGLRAVMTRKMSVAGNLVMARKMQQIFPIGW